MTSTHFRTVAALAASMACAGPLAAQHEGHHGHAAAAPMDTRAASGTAWQPDAAPHEGTHTRWGDWSVMVHGAAQLAYTDQRGPRGDRDLYVNNMLMVRGTRGDFGLRGMFSLEPATIGKRGYPLLLQTGETADGVHHLIDAQHPHDLFMELAAIYTKPLEGGRSAFVYFGLPGEPALGPPAFMHRFSGLEFPDAPISHHWLDSTHITYGVLTGGYVTGDVKFELSSFTGREPDQDRYDIESPKFDSVSARISWNPTANWSLQASGGRLNGPEQLDPATDVTRYTASAMYSADTAGGHLQVTGAWGRNAADPGETLDAVSLESAWRYRPRHTWLARAEWAEKNELFDHHSPLAGAVFGVGRISLGYLFDAWQSGPRALGVGVLGTVNFVPGALEDEYGARPKSATAFVRLRF